MPIEINYNSPEEVEKRKNQEDPLVMYFVVREDLNMGAGKIAAQIAHAAQILTMKYYQGNISENNAELMNKWLDGSFRKVVLRIHDKYWEKLKNELNKDDYVIVQDAGLTVVEPGTETVLGLFPQYKSQCHKMIKKLQVL